MAPFENLPIHIIVKYCDSRSGGEGVAYRFCEYLKQQGHDFVMVCGKDKEKKHGKHALSDHVVELGMLRPTRFIKYASFFHRAERYIAAHKGLVFSFERVRGAHVLRLAGTHKAFLHESLEGLSDKEKRRKQRVRAFDIYNRYAVWQERRAVTYPSVKRIIVPSHMSKHEVASLYPEQSAMASVIHNGIETKKFYPNTDAEQYKAQRKAARKALCQGLLDDSLYKSPRVVGFAGNAFQRKGLSHCIESLAMLPEDVVLLVAGADNPIPYVQRAKELGIAHRVRFIGHITDMPQFFHALDVFCLPSRNDPFGFVIAEALAAGVPVVTTDKAGGAEILRQGYSGVICSQLDDASVADAIGQGLLLGSMGDVKRALDIAATAPDATDMYAQYLAVARQAARVASLK